MADNTSRPPGCIGGKAEGSSVGFGLSSTLSDSTVTGIVTTSSPWQKRQRRGFAPLEACDARLAHIASKYNTLWVYGLPVLMASLGAMLDEQPREGETPKMKGSVLVAVAESREEALQFVKEDVYSTQGVWDLEKVQIYPVRVIWSVVLLGSL